MGNGGSWVTDLSWASTNTPIWASNAEEMLLSSRSTEDWITDWNWNVQMRNEVSIYRSSLSESTHRLSKLLTHWILKLESLAQPVKKRSDCERRRSFCQRGHHIITTPQCFIRCERHNECSHTAWYRWTLHTGDDRLSMLRGRHLHAPLHEKQVAGETRRIFERCYLIDRPLLCEVEDERKWYASYTHTSSLARNIRRYSLSSMEQ